MPGRPKSIEGVPVRRIVSEIERIRAQTYCEGGYSGEYEGKTVGELAKYEAKGIEHWHSPALKLIDSVLQINRQYKNFVEPTMNKIFDKYPDLHSFSDLRKLINKQTKRSFLKNVWQYNDPERYDLLCEVLKGFEQLKKKYGLRRDIYVMRRWGKEFDLNELDSDPIGSIHGIGLATCQYLRMQSGIDTLKPDRRVKASLNVIFHKNFSDIKAIQVVDEISKVTKYSNLELDQILVNDKMHYKSKGTKRATCR